MTGKRIIFNKDQVNDFILLCLRTQWTTLGYARQMEKDLNAEVERQLAEDAAKNPNAELCFG